MSKVKLNKALNKGPLVCAEGYIFELERRGYVQAGAYVPEVVIEHPEAVAQLHEEFARAGTDIIVALTYYAHREKLRLIGRENDLEQLNRTALRLAREAAEKRRLLLAGNICNTWSFTPGDNASAQKVRSQYKEQVEWSVSEGVDFVLAETLEYVGEALIALEVIKEAGVPAVVNFSPIYEKSKDGYDWIESAKLLERAGADVVGFNCARGPSTLLPLIRELRDAVNIPIAAIPVPYATHAHASSFQFLKRREGDSAYTIGLDQHYIDRQEAADFAKRAKEIGVDIIGLCCGAGPHHIRSLSEALGRQTEASPYSADMSKHGLLGDKKIVKENEKQFLELWH